MRIGPLDVSIYWDRWWFRWQWLSFRVWLLPAPTPPPPTALDDPDYLSWLKGEDND